MDGQKNDQQEIDKLNRHIKSWLKRLQYHIEAERLDEFSVNYTRECRLIAARLAKVIAAENNHPESHELIYEIFKESMGLAPKGSVDRYVTTLTDR